MSTEATQKTEEPKPKMTFDSRQEMPSKPEDEVEVIPKKLPKQTKIGVANARSEKYYKQFDFFFIRSCFRIMKEFYQFKFDEFYKER